MATREMRKIKTDVERLRTDLKEVSPREEMKLATAQAKKAIDAEVARAQERLKKAQKDMEKYISDNPKKSAAIAAAVGAAIGAGLTAAVMRRRR